MRDAISNEDISLITLAPFVHQQWGWFRIWGFHPWREQSSLVCLIPQVLIQVCICYLFQWLNIIHWHQMTVEVHELYTNLRKELTYQHITAITNSAHIISSVIWSTWLGYIFHNNWSKTCPSDSAHHKSHRGWHENKHRPPSWVTSIWQPAPATTSHFNFFWVT